MRISGKLLLLLKNGALVPAELCYCPLLQKKADFCETAISASCKIDVGTARRALFGQHRLLANTK